MDLLIWVFILLTISPCSKAANKIHRSRTEPNLISEQKFSKSQCEIIAECKSCSFLEMKELKECLVSGYVIVKKCTKVNLANSIDRFDYHVYEPCNMDTINFKWVHLFVIDCFLFLIFFVVWLNKYKTKLENRLFNKT